MSAHSFDLLALGEAMVEFNQQPSGQYLQGFGGDTSNAAIAAARAGAQVGYISRLGADVFGQWLRELWAAEGVDAQGVATASDAPTGVYMVTHTDAGHAFHYLRSGSAAARMQTGDLPLALMAQGRCLHVSAVSQAISVSANDAALAAMAYAKGHGVAVSYDPNLRLKLWGSLAAAREPMRQAMALADVFLPSFDDVAQLSGLQEPQALLDWCHAQGPALVVLKMGAQGAWVSAAGSRQHVAALPAQAVDATGAGDCFCGNFLARWLAGDAPLQAARYANAAASLAVEGFGAVAPLPRPDAVMARLNRGVSR